MSFARYTSVLLALLASSSPAFDCSKAGSAREKLVCSDPELSRLDSQLNEAYLKAVKKAPKIQSRKLLQAEQRAWLVLVADKCADKSSLGDKMKERIAVLKSQTGKARTTVSENPKGEDSDQACSPEITTEKAALKNGIQSEIRTNSFFCEGAAHPGCDITVSNTKNGKPFALSTIFKRGAEPEKILKKICEESTDDGDTSMSYWTERCEEIEGNHAALKPNGLVIAFDRAGPMPCGISPVIPWKRLGNYLAPDNSVVEARPSEK